MLCIQKDNKNKTSIVHRLSLVGAQPKRFQAEEKPHLHLFLAASAVSLRQVTLRMCQTPRLPWGQRPCPTLEMLPQVPSVSSH